LLISDGKEQTFTTDLLRRELESKVKDSWGLIGSSIFNKEIKGNFLSFQTLSEIFQPKDKHDDCKNSI
jgi:hypothetical protein